MGQKHKHFWEFWTPFILRCIRKSARSMYARVFAAPEVLKLSIHHRSGGTAPILEMARAYGLRPRLWLLIL